MAGRRRPLQGEGSLSENWTAGFYLHESPPWPKPRRSGPCGPGTQPEGWYMFP